MLSLFVSLTLLVPPAFGEENKPTDNNQPSQIEDLPQLQRPKNIWRPPLVSFLLPGFDQYWEVQITSGVLLSVYATAGVLSAGYSMVDREPEDIETSFEQMRGRDRQYFLGLQAYQTAGFLSAYQSFRTAAKTHGEDFNYLPKDERTIDVMLAPFDFRMMGRMTTWIPLLAFSGLMVEYANEHHPKMTADDFAFTSGISYQAGVGEEAFFRGYMMPIMKYATDSNIWSNAITAGVFGLAHLSKDNKFPIAQVAMGYYLGWLTQRNSWSIRESVFLHAWWDVIALSGAIAASRGDKDLNVFIPVYESTW